MNDFSLSQAIERSADMVGIDFASFVDPTEANKMNLADPIIGSVFEKDIPYGSLFAYCFRRFGYPNFGWDGYKDLTSYLLTTPLPNLFLRVSPDIQDINSISLHFLVEKSTLVDVIRYTKADQDTWRARMLDWAEKRGLPDWMDEWMSFYKTIAQSHFQNTLPSASWKETIPFLYSFGAEGSRERKLCRLIHKFWQSINEEYISIEPLPDWRHRSPDVSSWNDDDPLKPIAQAALVALKDLRTPVSVRDGLIDIYGVVSGASKVLEAAPSAGYPSGALGNHAPAEFADLHRLIAEVGSGDIKAGIEKVTEIVRSASSIKSKRGLKHG